jgi:hypothetical protein
VADHILDRVEHMCVPPGVARQPDDVIPIIGEQRPLAGGDRKRAVDRGEELRGVLQVPELRAVEDVLEMRAPPELVP